jgi:hypothetical protein
MSANIATQKYVTNDVTIGALGLIYDVTGLSATDRPAPTDRTVLNLALDGYNFKDSFLFSKNSDLSSPISAESIVDTVVDTKDVIVVTFLSSALEADTKYYMSLNIKTA